MSNYYHAYKDEDGTWKVRAADATRAYRRFTGRNGKRDAWVFARGWAKRNGGVAVLCGDAPDVADFTGGRPA